MAAETRRVRRAIVSVVLGVGLIMPWAPTAQAEPTASASDQTSWLEPDTVPASTPTDTAWEEPGSTNSPSEDPATTDPSVTPLDPADPTTEPMQEVAPIIGETDETRTNFSVEASEPIVVNGDYLIRSALPGGPVLDMRNGWTTPGTQLQLFQYNATTAQFFSVQCDQDGLCTIINKKSALALEIKGTANTTVVQQNTPQATAAQQWRFIPNADGSYTIESALKAGLVFDVRNGSAGNTTPIQVFTSNGTTAQNFFLKSLTRASEQVIPDGVYSFGSALGNLLTLDVPSAASTKNLTMQVFTANLTKAQDFEVTWVSGYYQIRSVASGLLLSPRTSSAVATTPVVQGGSVSTDNLLWVIERDYNGTYTIISKTTGLVWDVRNGIAAAGTSLQLFTYNGTLAQMWNLVSATVPSEQVIADGVYTFCSDLGNSLVLDVPNAASTNGLGMWVYTSNSSTAQDFQLTWTSGYYKITSVLSGRALAPGSRTPSPTTPVVQGGSATGDELLWAISLNADGTYTVTSKTARMVWDVRNGTATAGTKLQLFPSNDTPAQKWRLTTVTVPTGVLAMVPQVNTSQRVDIMNGWTARGTQAGTYANNGTLAQRFTVALVPGTTDTYTFRALNSGWYLADTNGKVVLEDDPTIASRQWVAERVSNGYRFMNLATGKYITVSNGNLVTAAATNAANQAFTFASDSSGVPQNTYVILSTPKGNAVALRSVAMGNSTRMVLQPVQASNTQKWLAVTNTKGWLNFTSPISGKAIDVVNGVSNEGTELQQYTVNLTSAQNWKLVPAGNGWFNLTNGLGTYATYGSDSANAVLTTTQSKERAGLFYWSQTTPEWRSSADLAALARNSLFDASSAGSITTFGSFELSDGDRNQLQNAINIITNRGWSVGVLMVDMNTGKGVAYNPDQQIYSASAIKGPYVAAAAEYNPGAVPSWANQMNAAIHVSSNTAYASVRNQFGRGPMAAYCNEAGVRTAIADVYYPWYSTREQAALWTPTYRYFLSGDGTANWVRSFYTASDDSVEVAFGGSMTYYSKSGWINEAGLSSYTQGGIIMDNGRPYILSIMTNSGQGKETPYSVVPIVRALQAIHASM